MRFVADFIGALREAGLQVSPAESLDALKAIKLLGLESRETSKTVLALTLVKRQADQVIYEELFDLYFAGVGKANASNKESNNELNKEADKSESESSVKAQEAKNNPHSSQADMSDWEGMQTSPNSSLGQALGKNKDMSLAITQAAIDEKLSSIVLFTQKNYFAYKIMQRLGDEALSAEIRADANSLEHKSSPEHKRKQRELIKSRARLLEQVKDYVEQQYGIFAQHKGLKYREEYLQQAKLSQLDRLDYKL
mgnify:FL=1